MALADGPNPLADSSVKGSVRTDMAGDEMVNVVLGEKGNGKDRSEMSNCNTRPDIAFVSVLSIANT